MTPDKKKSFLKPASIFMLIINFSMTLFHLVAYLKGSADSAMLIIFFSILTIMMIFAVYVNYR